MHGVAWLHAMHMHGVAWRCRDARCWVGKRQVKDKVITHPRLLPLHFPLFSDLVLELVGLITTEGDDLLNPSINLVVEDVLDQFAHAKGVVVIQPPK